MPQFTIIQTNCVTHKQTDLKTDIKVVRQTNRKTNKQVDQHTYIWSDSWTKRTDLLTD